VSARDARKGSGGRRCRASGVCMLLQLLFVRATAKRSTGDSVSMVQPLLLCGHRTRNCGMRGRSTAAQHEVRSARTHTRAHLCQLQKALLPKRMGCFSGGYSATHPSIAVNMPSMCCTAGDTGYWPLRMPVAFTASPARRTKPR
jgi:hypothetical protein